MSVHWPVNTIPNVIALLRHIQQSIRRRQIFQDGQTILVAVSGGLDSMVLLRVLHALSAKNGWKLVVAHLNHQLRGNASRADERLVRQTAAKLRLPVMTDVADVGRFARERKLSVEMAARKLRHDFLARMAVRLAIPTVALAHHADDQLELFFLRLLRGSGGEGLAGMRWHNPSPSDRQVKLVRPLLDLPKQVLRDFATQKKIRFREDASNESLHFQRNRVRHELLPLLRKHYQKSLGKTILRVMEIVGAESDFVAQAASDWLTHLRNPKCPRSASGLNSLPRIPFDKLPLAVQRRVIQLQLIAHETPSDFELIESLRLAPHSPVTVPAESTAPASSSLRYLSRDPSGEVQLGTRLIGGFQSRSRPASLGGKAGEIVFADLKITWRKNSGNGKDRPKSLVNCEYFDADKVGSSIILRHWRPGDRFEPIGMKTSVKLQNFFTNEKVPRDLRRRLVIAIADNGEIFWVEGLRISEQFKLSKRSKSRLQWRWNRA